MPFLGSLSHNPKRNSPPGCRSGRVQNSCRSFLRDLAHRECPSDLHILSSGSQLPRRPECSDPHLQHRNGVRRLVTGPWASHRDVPDQLPVMPSRFWATLWACHEQALPSRPSRSCFLDLSPAFSSWCSGHPAGSPAREQSRSGSVRPALPQVDRSHLGAQVRGMSCMHPGLSRCCDGAEGRVSSSLPRSVGESLTGELTGGFYWRRLVCSEAGALC